MIRNTTMPITVPPYDHQQHGYEFTLGLYGLLPSKLHSNGAALLMEMGTGKSLTSIGVAGTLYQYGYINRLLIVAPLSITTVWLEEFEKFAAFPYALTVLGGSSAKKRKAIEEFSGNGLEVLVINYESAWRLEKELSTWQPDMIICDEDHKIKTHNASASKAMHRLGAAAKYRMLLTGTPVTNKALDIFSQYKFLNPAIFGRSFYTFRSHYFYMTGYGQHTPVMKDSMEKDFTKRLHSIAFRATKDECLDLPETTDIVRKVILETKAMKIYQRLVEESYAELSSGEVTVPNVLTRLIRLSQLTGGFLGNDDNSRVEQVSSAKLSVLEDIVDASAEENKKLVIIARFVPEIHAIQKMNVYCKYYEVVYILFHTGMRISEFCGLTIKDIDLKNKVVNIDHQLLRGSDMRYIIQPTKTNAGTRQLPITNDVAECFRAILTDREPPKAEHIVDGYSKFLFVNKNGMPLVALYWEHRFQHMVARYNEIFRIPLPKITPHVCRHTYCSNMAKAGMNPKTLQYLMGHSEIGVTLNTYTHLGLEDAIGELKKMEEERARQEIERGAEQPKEQRLTQRVFRVICGGR